MNIYKLLLIGAGLVLLGFIAFPLAAFLYKAVWTLFWLGLIGGAGYAGYKYLNRNSSRGQLKSGDDLALSYQDSFDRELDEIRRKYLPK